MVLNYSVEFVLLLLLGFVTVSASRQMSDDEIDLIIGKFKEWGGNAPEIDVVTEGKVTGGKGKRQFDFKFLAEDGQKCKSKVSLSTNGSGRHSWECDNRPWKGSEEEGDNSRRRKNKKTMNTRKRGKKMKKFKRKGSAKNPLKRKKKKRRT